LAAASPPLILASAAMPVTRTPTPIPPLAPAPTPDSVTVASVTVPPAAYPPALPPGFPPALAPTAPALDVGMSVTPVTPGVTRSALPLSVLGSLTVPVPGPPGGAALAWAVATIARSVTRGGAAVTPVPRHELRAHPRAPAVAAPFAVLSAMR
jgi:hypothetical protein